MLTNVLSVNTETTTVDGHTEIAKNSEGTATHVQSEKENESQEIAKSNAVAVEEVSKTKHENAFQLEAPEKRKNGLDQGVEDKDLHVQSTMEVATGFRDDTDGVTNRRSGNQGAQAETLNDALKIEADEGAEKVET